MVGSCMGASPCGPTSPHSSHAPLIGSSNEILRKEYAHSVINIMKHFCFFFHVFVVLFLCKFTYFSISVSASVCLTLIIRQCISTKTSLQFRNPSCLVEFLLSNVLFLPGNPPPPPPREVHSIATNGNLKQ